MTLIISAESEFVLASDLNGLAVGEVINDVGHVLVLELGAVAGKSRRVQLVAQTCSKCRP